MKEVIKMKGDYLEAERTEFIAILYFSEFASYQSLKFESISVETFTFGKDQYVVFPQPFAGTCSFLEWDHVEMTFRTYDTIESEFKNKDRPVMCCVIINWCSSHNFIDHLVLMVTFMFISC